MYLESRNSRSSKLETVLGLTAALVHSLEPLVPFTVSYLQHLQHLFDQARQVALFLSYCNAGSIQERSRPAARRPYMQNSSADRQGFKFQNFSICALCMQVLSRAFPSISGLRESISLQGCFWNGPRVCLGLCTL